MLQRLNLLTLFLAVTAKRISEIELLLQSNNVNKRGLDQMLEINKSWHRAVKICIDKARKFD